MARARPQGRADAQPEDGRCAGARAHGGLRHISDCLSWRSGHRGHGRDCPTNGLHREKGDAMTTEGNAMLIGLSLSCCIKDILLGRVKDADVLALISGTDITTEAQW